MEEKEQWCVDDAVVLLEDDQDVACLGCVNWRQLMTTSSSPSSFPLDVVWVLLWLQMKISH